jgi:hypothetical protein
VPRHDERPFRSDEERGRALDRSAIQDADTLVAWQTEESAPSRGGPRLLRILGDIGEDGAGPNASCEVERFLDDIWNLLDVLHEIVVLCDRHGDAVDVCFLKCEPAPRNVRGAGSRGVGYQTVSRVRARRPSRRVE